MKGQRNDIKITVSILLSLKMVSKLITFILILFISGFVYAKDADHDQSSEPPSDLQYLNDLLSKLESHLEISEVLSALNESTSHLKKSKDEIIADIESAVEKKLKVYDAQLKQAENAFIAEDEKRTALMKDGMLKLKQEIIAGIDGVDTLPRDCREVQRRGNIDSGIYRIRPELSPADFLVWCEMGTHEGGWTRILARFDGSENFYLNWTDYRDGFGKLSGEHWLGLDHLYELTNSKPNELLFELVDWDWKRVHALYDNFKIGSESEYYKIHSIGNYSGDAGNSFRYHLGLKFSTADVDQDNSTAPGSCATNSEGAWWYGSCYVAHLTGRYVKNPGSYYHNSGIQWLLFPSFHFSLREARMMVRPRTG